jgi:hypothetical protein
MNQTRLKKIGGAVFGALTVICLTFGTSAKACNVPGIGLRSGYLPDPSVFLSSLAPPSDNSQDAHASSASSERSGDRNSPASIVGLWQVTYVSGSTVTDMAFEVFHSDGTEMLNDITPPAEGNVCLGVWTQTGGTAYKLTHPSWTFDSNGNLTGTAQFSVTITMTSADQFSGTYTLGYYDTTGKPVGVYNGTLTAARILPNY